MSACLRALALGAAAGSFAAALDAGSAALVAALAAATGARLAEAGSRPRPLARLALAVALGWLGSVLAAALAADPRAAQRLGAGAALVLAECVRWLALCGPAAFALRSLARRSALASVAELGLAAAALAVPLAAHRGGMTHRPLAIGDWTGTQGIDPVLPFLAAGALAAVLLSTLLLRESRRGRALLQIGAVALLALAILQQVRGSGALAPAGSRALGLTGDSAPGFEGGAGVGAGAPVAIAVLHDDWSPPSGVFYFRQSVLSQWSGDRLVRATRDGVDLDVPGAFPEDEPTATRQAPPADGRTPLETTTALLFEHAQPFALDAPLEIARAPNPAPERFARAFRVRSSAPGLDLDALRPREAGDPGWSEAERHHYTQAPDDPRYAELAARIAAALPAADARSPLARALAVKTWLEQHATYSRESSHSAAPDPVGSFLFGDRSGHCVHFANAAVYLMRALGLPARVALGYALPEAVRAGGSALLIRGADAHAWPELYLAGAGWVPVDPTPRQALEALAPPPDLELQRRLGELLRGPAREPPPPLPTPPGVDLPAAAAVSLALLLLFCLAPGLWRRLAPHVARPAQLPRAAYRAALDRLSAVGLARRSGESRERFAARAATLAPSFAALTHTHLRAALGGRAPADAREPLRLYTEVRRELRARAPVWRRALGQFDPFAWWRAR